MHVNLWLHAREVKVYVRVSDINSQWKMARDYDHLFKLLIIGDSGEYGRGFHIHIYSHANCTHELSLR